MARAWRWTERAGEWDREQQRKDEAKWDERRVQIKEADWELSEQMRQRARQMLSWPISKTNSTQDGKTVIIEPTHWTLHHAVHMAKESSQIGRLACDMETERIKREVDAMDEEQLQAEAIATLRSLGYDVRGPDNVDNEGESDDDMPFTTVAMMDALKRMGFLVVPPTPPEKPDSGRMGPFQS